MSLFDALRRARAADDPNLMIDAIPYGGYLGLRSSVLDGDLVCRLPYDCKFIGNPLLPALHGGVIGALLENAALLSLLWGLKIDRLPKTINMTVDYLRSAGPKETYASSAVTKEGRRVANVRVEAWQEDRSRLVAVAYGHFLTA